MVNLLRPVISAMGYEMWGVEHFPKGHASLVRIYIDNDSGISLADCERVSEQVTGILDVNDPIRGPYNLEISSPGLDRPLFTLEQFERFIGHEAGIRLRTKLDGRRNVTGKIIEVNDDSVTILGNDSRYSIPADTIEKANIVQ